VNPWAGGKAIDELELVKDEMIIVDQ